MDKLQKVYICTRVYNTKPYLEQCITSVLSQTYVNFEYILIDNGCTDGSTMLLKEFAAKDKRIKLYRFEENHTGPIDLQILQTEADEGYVTVLDSDDWWEPDYLEKLITFAEDNNLDIACTGTVMHNYTRKKEVFRSTSQPLIIPRSKFPEMLPWYHAFFRPIWGKLFRRDVFYRFVPNMVFTSFYGGDTFFCFQYLRRSSRIGISNTVLHHYRIHENSYSYQYYPERFDCDVFLYNDAIDFLTSFGPVSDYNRQFLQLVYVNAVSDTLGVIGNSNLASPDKLQEYTRIVTHPITLSAYRQNMDGEAIQRSRSILLQLTLQSGMNLNGQDDSNLRTIIQTLLPHCGLAVTGQNLPLIVQNKALLHALLADDSELMMQQILELIAKKANVKKYNLVQMLQALAVEKPLLSPITDAAFLRHYSNIYLALWSGEYSETLEEMTGLLLNNQVGSSRKTFLKLYISLAAILSEESAFIFGKLRLADLLLKQGERDGCQALVTDLEEMGLTDNEELDTIRAKLDT